MTSASDRSLPSIPEPFQIARDLPPGNYRLTDVFGGFQEVPPYSKYPIERRKLTRLVEQTRVQVLPERVWMYVAPHEAPPWAAKYGWKPFTTSENCIVVGRTHLSKSASLVLYLDILHEFCHIIQRHNGRELWDISNGYVGSPTELEAYRFCLAEARRLGVTDAFLRRYLKVGWVQGRDHHKLLRNLGVKPGRRRSRPRSRPNA